jgi:ParB-like nuclease domain
MSALNRKQFRVPVPENVSQKYAGGKGHLEGDPTESATGMVPVHALRPFMEFDRAGHQADSHSAQRISEIVSDITSGKGITNPLMVAYDHKNKWGVLGEGNHRLAAAIQAGVSHVPVTVYRDSGLGSRKREGIGSHLAMITDFGRGTPQTEDYVPTNIHPEHFKQFIS